MEAKSISSLVAIYEVFKKVVYWASDPCSLTIQSSSKFKIIGPNQIFCHIKYMSKVSQHV